MDSRRIVFTEFEGKTVGFTTHGPVSKLVEAFEELSGENTLLEKKLSLAEGLLIKALYTLDNMHGCKTEVYIAIEKYFEEE